MFKLREKIVSNTFFVTLINLCDALYCMFVTHPPPILFFDLTNQMLLAVAKLTSTSSKFYDCDRHTLGHVRKLTNLSVKHPFASLGVWGFFF
jgi:hypothetical protein